MTKKMCERAMEVLFGFLLFFISENALSKCANNFSAINQDCIQGYEGKFKSQKIPVVKSLTNKIFFYKTAEGSLGKLKILSVITEKESSKKNSPKECVVYVEGSTFTGKSSFTPDPTLAIKSELGIWNRDHLSLTQAGHNDIILFKDKKSCTLEFKTSQVAFYKKIDDKAHLQEGSQILFYSCLILIGLALFLIARSTLEEEDKFKASEALEDVDESSKEKKLNGIVLRYSRPFFKRYFTPIVMSLKNRQRFKTKYKRRLANAGLAKELSPEDFFAFKIFLIIGFPVVFLILRAAMEESWPLSYVPIVSVLGFYYPNIWLNGQIERRKEEVLIAMPFIVDMLALSVEAGLDFMAAMQKVIEKAPNSALVDEFETLIKETKIGASRAEGLRQLSWRVDVLPVNSFCATLIAADSVGASIGPLLKQLSNELRQKRSSEAEKKGATAATKILFPMILFIMPAVFIAIAGPMILQFISGGR